MNTVGKTFYHLLKLAASKFGADQCGRQKSNSVGLLNNDDLYCRVIQIIDKDASALRLEICGSIEASCQAKDVIAEVSLMDITDGIQKPKPVYTSVKKWQKPDSDFFCYVTSLGKLPYSNTILPDWITVGQINIDWLCLPRKGKRTLRIDTKIIAKQSRDVLVRSTCSFNYNNDLPGYEDEKENALLAIAIASSLALNVAAADKSISKAELKTIKGWRDHNIEAQKIYGKNKFLMNKFCAYFTALLPALNIRRSFCLSQKIRQMAPLAIRYDILDLCINVASANPAAGQGQLDLLKSIARWLDISHDRFRSMMEKALPVFLDEAKDADVCFGITPQMNPAQARSQLSKEYRKWNARVTNADPRVKIQAEQMLKLIAEQRSQFI
jgi:hypothetical protein